MNPLVSIILPTYNNMDTIFNTIKSVMDQSYKRWELIIVDDGSDRSNEILLSQISSLNNKIKIYKNEHKGAAVARNEGIKRAKGKYIAFIDADDKFSKNFIAEGVKKLETYHADVAIYDYYRVSDHNKYLVKVGITPFNSYTACWNKMYKKKLWKDLYFPQGMTIEDLEVVPVAVGRATKRVKVSHAFYYYTNRYESITNSLSLKNELEVISAIALLNKNLRQFQVSVNKKEYASFINDFIYWHTINIAKSKDTFIKKRKVFNEIKKQIVKINGKIYFGGSNRFIFRKKIVLFNLKLGLYKIAIFFAEL